MRRFHEVRENPERRIENSMRKAIANLPAEINPISETSRLPKEIIPKTDITADEAENFWDNLFKSLPDQIQ